MIRPVAVQSTQEATTDVHSGPVRGGEKAGTGAILTGWSDSVGEKEKLEVDDGEDEDMKSKRI